MLGNSSSNVSCPAIDRALTVLRRTRKVPPDELMDREVLYAVTGELHDASDRRKSPGQVCVRPSPFEGIAARSRELARKEFEQMD